MSNFYGKRFLSALMGALTVLGSSVASASKRRAKEDTLDSGKTSSRRRTDRNVKRRHGRKIKADREAKGVSGLRAVLKETGGRVVRVFSDGKGGFVAFVKTPTGVVTVSVVGASLLALLSYLTYSAFSGGEKTDGGDQSPKSNNPVDGPNENPNNENPKPGDENLKSGNENPKSDGDPNKSEENPKTNGDTNKPKEEPEVVNYKVMSDLLSDKNMEKLFFDCLFGKVFSLSLKGSLDSFGGGREKADKFFVDLVAGGFSEGENGKVVISLKDMIGEWRSVCSTSSYNADAFCFESVSDSIGSTCAVSRWLSKFIANKGDVSGKQMLDHTQESFLKLIFLTCWYYALATAYGNVKSFSVEELEKRFASGNGADAIFQAWDAISKYVDYLFKEAGKENEL